MLLPVPVTSRSNARVKALRAAMSGKASRPGDLLAVEGEHLISEAMRSGLRFTRVYLREGDQDVLRRPLLHGLHAPDWLLLSRDVFASAVDTTTPQGIAATFALPQIPLPEPQAAAETWLVLEDLQDPGNLGTLIRSAEAFRVSGILLSPASVSAWNNKAVRASAGSVFRVPIERMTMRDAKQWLAARGIPLFGAVARGENAVASPALDLTGHCALMIGNEGAGLSGEALALADARVHIPCAVESLNAAIAGSTLLYEALRQKLGRAAQSPP